MKKILLLTLMLISFNIIEAQEVKGAKDIEEVNKICESITTDFEKGDLDQAFKKLRTIWVIPDTELMKLELQTNKQIAFIADRFGKALETKFIKSELVEDVAVKQTFVVKFEYHILRFKYIFYKGKKGLWYLNSFTWDDQIARLFETD